MLEVAPVWRICRVIWLAEAMQEVQILFEKDAVSFWKQKRCGKLLLFEGFVVSFCLQRQCRKYKFCLKTETLCHFESGRDAGSCSCLKDLSCYFAKRSYVGSNFCLKDLSRHWVTSRSNTGSMTCVKNLSCHFVSRNDVKRNSFLKATSCRFKHELCRK